MELVQVGGKIFCINFASEETLRDLLAWIDAEIADETFMMSFADQGNYILRSRDKILKELHSHRFYSCLEEMQILFKFKHTKKAFVVEWLSKIDSDPTVDPNEPSEDDLRFDNGTTFENHDISSDDDTMFGNERTPDNKTKFNNGTTFDEDPKKSRFN